MLLVYTNNFRLTAMGWTPKFKNLGLTALFCDGFTLLFIVAAISAIINFLKSLAQRVVQMEGGIDRVVDLAQGLGSDLLKGLML